jgi:DNA-binding transcriptional regulator LsrR (DeoR family)
VFTLTWNRSAARRSGHGSSTTQRARRSLPRSVAIGSAGASYLETTLTGGERIGISSRSQTLLAAVDRMQSLRLSGADSVIQLVGGFGAASAQAEGNRLLTELARLIGATPIFVPAPGLVGKRPCATA